MGKIDFKGIIQGMPKEDEKEAKKPKSKQINAENSPKKEEANFSKKVLLKEPVKKLEEEITEFNSKPKHKREKESEGFDFKQITNQIKDKVKDAPKFDTQKPPLGKSKSFEITRIPSGIPGLDDLIEGGFEQGSSVLVVGSAGAGKSLFSLQFLHQGAKDYNEPGIFISFEESRESLYKHSSAFDWDFEALEKRNMFRVMEYKPHQVEKLMQQGGGPIRDAIKEMGAKRLVIDSITSYGLLFKDEYEKRESTLGLFENLKKWGTTNIIISELPPKVAEVKEGSVGFLTDAILSLYYSKQTDSSERVHSMEILKMRGTKHTDKLSALQFEDSGLVVYSDVEVF